MLYSIRYDVYILENVQGGAKKEHTEHEEKSIQGRGIGKSRQERIGERKRGRAGRMKKEERTRIAREEKKSKKGQAGA